MKIGEFLKGTGQHLVTCMPDDMLEAIAKAMHMHGIGAMPVCEMGIHMVGIVSERDLVRTLATTGWNELRNLRARDIMTRRARTCGPDDDMRTAERMMRQHHFRHVPVVDAERVVGMLSIRDTQALRLRESEEEINILRDVVVATRR
jgi:CBS domain-containing protein